VSKSNEDREPKLNRREAFQAAASALDATFVAAKRRSGDQVHLQHGPWKVILDIYVVRTGQATVTYTRTRALYIAKEDFTLCISRKNVFTRFAELFGVYGLLVGDQELERKYTIKSSSEPRCRSLMMDLRLRELIMVQPSLRLEIRQLPWGKRRKTGDGVRAVAVQTTGVIKDPERLANYVLVVGATLDQLVRIGAAHGEPVAEGRTYAIRRRV
jgi:hypothetical protein